MELSAHPSPKRGVGALARAVGRNTRLKLKAHVDWLQKSDCGLCAPTSLEGPHGNRKLWAFEPEHQGHRLILSVAIIFMCGPTIARVYVVGKEGWPSSSCKCGNFGEFWRHLQTWGIGYLHWPREQTDQFSADSERTSSNNAYLFCQH